MIPFALVGSRLIPVESYYNGTDHVQSVNVNTANAIIVHVNAIKNIDAHIAIVAKATRNAVIVPDRS